MRGGRRLPIARTRSDCSKNAALQQHDERPGADAADTDDLAGEVDDLELLQQMPSTTSGGTI
jgi:hypothetical protein